MAGGCDELREIIKPKGDHVWNGSGTIEGSVVYFESQIDDLQTSLDPKNVQIWEKWQKMRKIMMYERWKMMNTV